MSVTYGVTGASGRLGRLVLDVLLRHVEPKQVVALTRSPAKLIELEKNGVKVREFNFDKIRGAELMDIDRLLLISGSEIGQRERQHCAAIQAAKEAGVRFIAYTSVLHANTCTIELADEHRATEAHVKASGLKYAIIRHGWYTENTTMNAEKQIACGKVIGCSGDGRQSTASRADYAEGDVAVLLDHSLVDEVFEFAGDSYTLGDYAETLSEVSGRSVKYVDMSEENYREVLERDLPRGLH